MDGKPEFQPRMIGNYTVSIRTRAGTMINLIIPPISWEELFNRIKTLELAELRVQTGIPLGIEPKPTAVPTAAVPAAVPPAVPENKTDTPVNKVSTAENDLFFLKRKKKTTQGHRSRVVSWM